MTTNAHKQRRDTCTSVELQAKALPMLIVTVHSLDYLHCLLHCLLGCLGWIGWLFWLGCLGWIGWLACLWHGCDTLHWHNFLLAWRCLLLGLRPCAARLLDLARRPQPHDKVVDILFVLKDAQLLPYLLNVIVGVCHQQQAFG